MTLEQRAKEIAEKACPMDLSYRRLGIYHLALRMLREAVDEAVGKAGDAPSHREWTGAK